MGSGDGRLLQVPPESRMLDNVRQDRRLDKMAGKLIIGLYCQDMYSYVSLARKKAVIGS